ncbi:MAG: glycoside hydrolase family 140 protein [Cyclobacteriaceae bacterium]|nr:glycoside hydrolase family 140 protein [Cyclobacteriaceae bacterium]
MNKSFFYLVFLAFSLGCQNQDNQDTMQLKVSTNGRYLEYSNGKPFLYLGDTAWELFHKLDREEASEYLENRAEKGFTIIQAVVLAELDGLHTPNAYGEVPLTDLDPAKPTEKYFEHVDFIVNKAEQLGLFVGMLPTWGDKVPNDIGGIGPVVFNPENARIFGEFLGKRYKDKPIIWILGGDRNVDNENAYQIWKEMAAGLKAGDGGLHLISYHPRGVHSSSYWLHNEEWLDFNMYQTAHFHRFQKVYEHAAYDYMMYPVKPTLDSEPAYEDIPMEFWTFNEWRTDPMVFSTLFDSDNLIEDTAYFKKGYFTDYDVRVHAYWNLLSGACGYTYGNNAVWQMFSKGSDPEIPCLYDWRESLDRPGAQQIRHIKTLFTEYCFSKMVPDQSAITGKNYRNDLHIRAAVATDGSFLLAYMAQGQPVSVVMKKIAGQNVNARWFDPRNGKMTALGQFQNVGTETFTPPTSGIGHDWVLVLEDADVYKSLE